jgi:FAD/FMN-containing dehydrogenase
MTELSPAAQAVLDAINEELNEAPWDVSFLASVSAAAALRAAADQVKHEFPLGPEYTEWDSGHDAGIRRALNKFLTIAAELEALDG